MEKNKTIIMILTIVLAVAVFVGVGIWLFNPKNAIVASGSSIPVQYVQGMNAGGQVDAVPSPSPLASPGNPPPAPGIVNQQVLIVDGSKTNSSNDYIIGPDGHLIRNPGSVAGQTPTTATPEISTGLPAASQVPSGTTVTANASGAEVRTNSGMTISAGTQTKPAVNPSQKPDAKTEKPVPGTKSNASKATHPKKSEATAKTAPKAKTGKEFWIQVISTTSKDRVEQVRKDLAALGFNGRISTFAKDKTDFFRLRYGPYGSRDEAKKFLDWVKIIKGLDGSFVAEEPNAAVSVPKPTAKPVAPVPAKPAPVKSDVPKTVPNLSTSATPLAVPAETPATK